MYDTVNKFRESNEQEQACILGLINFITWLYYSLNYSNRQYDNWNFSNFVKDIQKERFEFMQTLYDSVYDNIITEMQKQNKSQKELTDYLKVSKSTFTDWKSGKSKSFMKYLPEIADFLDVSVDYLLGKTYKKNKTTPEEQPLTDAQEALLNYCSDLSNEDLAKVIDYIELLKLKNNAEQKERIKLVARSGEQREIEASQDDIDWIASSLNEDTTSDY